MTRYRTIIILCSALCALAFNSCDSGGGGIASEPVAAPESISNKTLTLDVGGGPVPLIPPPACEVDSTVFNFQGAQILNEDGLAYILDDSSYLNEGVRATVTINFSNGRTYVIRLNFTTSSSGTFILLNSKDGDACNAYGVFTLFSNSPAIDGLELTP
ncbi:MAG: hypothetical protein ACSHX6_05995 [Akkermansiaceae bacterium]